MDNRDRDVRKQGTVEIGDLLKYGKAATQFSLLPLFYIGAQVLAQLKEVDSQHTLYFMLFGVFIVIVWVLRDTLLDRGDSELQAELHDNLEPKDREAQTAIFAGLQSIGLVDCDPDKPIEELLTAHVINSLCFSALAPAVFQNHHAKELRRSKSERYINRKVRQVLDKFSGRNAGYCALAQGLLGDVPFEKAVRAFVVTWVRESVCPAVMKVCEEKVAYYSGLERRKNISSKKRKEVQGWREKNEQYLVELEDLMAASSVQTDYITQSFSGSRITFATGTP